MALYFIGGENPLGRTKSKVKEKKTNIVKEASQKSGEKKPRKSKRNPMGTAMDGFNVSAKGNQRMDKPVKKQSRIPKRSGQKGAVPPLSIDDNKMRAPKRSMDKKKPVKIIFLGGVGEIGKNMTAIEYEKDIIVIDAGQTFTNGDEMPGIDSVVPDVTYLSQNKDKIRGIILTHGHEDHIGGVAYLMKELNANTPIFGTKLTLMLTDNKLQENRITNANMRVVEVGEKIK